MKSLILAIAIAFGVSAVSVNAGPKASITPIITKTPNGVAFDGEWATARWECLSAPVDATVEISVRINSANNYPVITSSKRSGRQDWLVRIRGSKISTESAWLEATWYTNGQVYAQAESKPFKISLKGEVRSVTAIRNPFQYPESYYDSQAYDVPIYWTSTGMPEGAIATILAHKVGSESGTVVLGTAPMAEGKLRVNCGNFATGLYAFYIAYTPYPAYPSTYFQSDGLEINIDPFYSIPNPTLEAP